MAFDRTGGDGMEVACSRFLPWLLLFIVISSSQER